MVFIFGFFIIAAISHCSVAHPVLITLKERMSSHKQQSSKESQQPGTRLAVHPEKRSDSNLKESVTSEISISGNEIPSEKHTRSKSSDRLTRSSQRRSTSTISKGAVAKSNKSLAHISSSSNSSSDSPPVGHVKTQPWSSSSYSSSRSGEHSKSRSSSSIKPVMTGPLKSLASELASGSSSTSGRSRTSSRNKRYKSTATGSSSSSSSTIFGKDNDQASTNFPSSTGSHAGGKTSKTGSGSGGSSSNTIVDIYVSSQHQHSAGSSGGGGSGRQHSSGKH